MIDRSDASLLFQVRAPRFATKPRANPKRVLGGSVACRGGADVTKSGAETAISAAAAGGRKLVMRAPVVAGIVAGKGAMAAAAKGIAGASALRAAASKRLGGVARRGSSHKLSRDLGAAGLLAEHQVEDSSHKRPVVEHSLAACFGAAEDPAAGNTCGQGQDGLVTPRSTLTKLLREATPSEVATSGLVSEPASEITSEVASEEESDEESNNDESDESEQDDVRGERGGDGGVADCGGLIVCATSPLPRALNAADDALGSLALAAVDFQFQETSGLVQAGAAFSLEEGRGHLTFSNGCARSVPVTHARDDQEELIAAGSQYSLSAHSSSSAVAPPAACFPSQCERVVAPPLLLSGKHVSLSVNHGVWSKPLPCEVVGASWSVNLADHEFGVEVRPGPDKAPRSRLVLVQPLYQLLNRSGVPLLYRTKGELRARGVMSSVVGACAAPVAFHWDVAAEHGAASDSAPGGEITLRLLQIALAAAPEAVPGDPGGVTRGALTGSSPQDARSGDWTCEEQFWSGAFTINGPSDSGHVIAVPQPVAPMENEETPGHATAFGSSRRRLIQVTVEQCGPSMMVCFDLASTAPFRLHNECSFAILFGQVGVGSASPQTSVPAPRHAEKLMPGESINYTWDEPMGQHLLTLVPMPPLEGRNAAALALNAPAQLSGFMLNPEHVAEVAHGHPPLFWSSVLLEGGPLSKAVRLSERSPAMLAANGELGDSFSCLLGSVGVSLVDTAKRYELLYCRAQALHFSLMQTELEYEAQLQLDRLQLDAQTPHASFPVVVLGQSSGGGNGSGSTGVFAHGVTPMPARPWLLCSLRKRRTEKRLRSVVIAVAELRLHLEERFLYACLSFASRVLPAPPRAAATTATTAMPFSSPRSVPVAAPSGLWASASSSHATMARWLGGGSAMATLDDDLSAPEPQNSLPPMTTFVLPNCPLPAQLIERKRPWYVDELCVEELRVQAVPPLPTQSQPFPSPLVLPLLKPPLLPTSHSYPCRNHYFYPYHYPTATSAQLFTCR